MSTNTTTIIIPRWRGDSDYDLVADQSGNILRVVYRDDSFLKKGVGD